MNIKSPIEYANALSKILLEADWEQVTELITALREVRDSGGRLYVCGNGGSAANAMHLANDFLYGISIGGQSALKVEALTSNTSVLTCLGNDLSYEEIFSRQLAVKGARGDLLLGLSGSGNSPNVLDAVRVAVELGVRTAAILGFDGGSCKDAVDIPIHFSVNDMQLSEDLQLVVGHICMKELARL